MLDEPDDKTFEENLSRLLRNGADLPQLDPQRRVEMLEALRAKQAKGAEAPAEPRRRGIHFPGRLVRITLCAAAALILGWCLTRLASRPEREGTPAESRSLVSTLVAGEPVLKRTLPDGTVLIARRGANFAVGEPRRLRLDAGDVYLIVAKSDSPFIVQTPHGKATATGTRFAASVGIETVVDVAQGIVRLLSEWGEVELSPGEEGVLSPSQQPRREPAPRISYQVNWAREALAQAKRLVPTEKRQAGELVAVDPSGQDVRLSLRKYLVDVYVEDGLARTTVDQTFFNHLSSNIEGTFYFPLPPDASVNRLAMYVNGELMEGGMVERSRGQEIYTSILYQRRDPALLEMMEGNVFKMRIFPIEARQEKRIFISYTQRLSDLYGTLRYWFPMEHTQSSARELGIHVRVKGGAGAYRPESSTHELGIKDDQGDLVLDYAAKDAKTSQDFLLALVPKEGSAGASPSQDGSAGASPSRNASPSRGGSFATVKQDGFNYVFARVTPTLPGGARSMPRDWFVLNDISASRTGLDLQAQAYILGRLIEEADDHDRVTLINVNTRAIVAQPAFASVRGPEARLPVAAAKVDLPLGATNLAAGIEAVAGLVRDRHTSNAHILYLGDGIATDGKTSVDELLSRLNKVDAGASDLPSPRGSVGTSRIGGATFIGIGVGKKADATFLQAAADQTGGLFTLINPDEDIDWRVFDLVAALNTPRLVGLTAQFETADGKTADIVAYPSTRALSDGESLSVLGRTQGELPACLVLRGMLGDIPFERRYPLAGARADGEFIPRLWAKRHIDELLKSGPEHKDEIVALSKQYYIMTPFTSLIVLENEAMYREYHVERGRKDQWALYPAPAKIPVMQEPMDWGRWTWRGFTPQQPQVEAKAAPNPIQDIVDSVQFRINAPFYTWRPQADTLGRFALYELLDSEANATPLVMSLLQLAAGQESPGATSAPGVSQATGGGKHAFAGDDISIREVRNGPLTIDLFAGVPRVYGASAFFTSNILSNSGIPWGDDNLTPLYLRSAGHLDWGDTNSAQRLGSFHGRWQNERLLGDTRDRTSALSDVRSQAFFSHALYSYEFTTPVNGTPTQNWLHYWGAANADRPEGTELSGYFDPFGSRRLGIRNTARSESEIAGGLIWLANAQNRDTVSWDNSWDYAWRNGGRPGYDVGQTGLSLLAFLGAGYTHRAANLRADTYGWNGAQMDLGLSDSLGPRHISVSHRSSADRRPAVSLSAEYDRSLTTVPGTIAVLAADWLVPRRDELMKEEKSREHQPPEGVKPSGGNEEELAAVQAALKDIDRAYLRLEDTGAFWGGQGRSYRPELWSFTPPEVRADPGDSATWDLTRYAPGLYSTASDIADLVAAEHGSPPAGKVSAEAASLIEAARKAIQPVRVRFGKDAPPILVGPGDRFAVERTTEMYLEEQMVCDGESIYHLYGELGLAAHRKATELRRAALRQLAPHLLEPADRLARRYDINLAERAADRFVLKLSPIVPGHSSATVGLPDRGNGSTAGQASRGTPESAEGNTDFHILAAVSFDGRILQTTLFVQGKATRRLSYTYEGAKVTARWFDEGHEIGSAEFVAEPFSPNADTFKAHLYTYVVFEMPIRRPSYYQARLKGMKADAPEYPDLKRHLALACLQDVDRQHPGGPDDAGCRAMLKALAAIEKAGGRGELGDLVLLGSSGYPLSALPKRPNVRVSADNPVFTYFEFAFWYARPGSRLLRGENRGTLIGHLAAYAAATDGCEDVGDLDRLLDDYPDSPLIPAAADYTNILGNRPEVWLKLLDCPRWRAMAALMAATRSDGDAARTRVAAALAQLHTELSGKGIEMPISSQQETLLRQADGGKHWRTVLLAAWKTAADSGRVAPLLRFAELAMRNGENAMADEALARAKKLADSAVPRLARPAVTSPPRSDKPTVAQESSATGGSSLLTRLALAQSLWAGGRTKDALRLHDEVLAALAAKGIPASPALLAATARLAQQAGDPGQAIELEERALALEHPYLPEMINLQAFRQRYDWLASQYQNKVAQAAGAKDGAAVTDWLARARETFARWIEVDRENPAIYSRMATLQATAGRADDAWLWLSSILDAKPKDAQSHADIGTWYRGRGDGDAAQQWLARAAACDTANPRWLYERGRVLADLGRRDEARALFRQVIDGRWAAGHQAVDSQAKREIEK